MNPMTDHSPVADDGPNQTIDIDVLSLLFDSAPDIAFFVKDLQGRYLTVNHSLAERYGLKDKQAAIGRLSREICNGEFGELPSLQDDSILKTGRPLVDHLEMHWSRHREPVWCLTTKLPIRDAGGSITGLVGFSRDVRVPVQTEEIPDGFAKALQEFESTLSDSVTPAWLAQRSGLTAQKLTRFTKRVFGLTATQVITRVRIAAASRLLKETSKQVSDIALECGFYDHSAFTRAFRNATGVTPTEFRNQN